MFKQGTGNVADITTSLITTPSLGHQAADHRVRRQRYPRQRRPPRYHSTAYALGGVQPHAGRYTPRRSNGSDQRHRRGHPLP
jgi:hypothetical protein